MIPSHFDINSSAAINIFSIATPSCCCGILPPPPENPVIIEQFLAGIVIYAGEQAQQRTQWQALPWSAAETGALSSINRSQKT